MQRERNSLDSFPEPIDLNQGSFPNSTSMDSSTSWDNMLDPVENRMSNYMTAASNDGSGTSTNVANDRALSFSPWDCGESSSGANNLQDGDDSKTRLGWSPCLNSGPDARSSEAWCFESSNISSSSYLGNQATGRSLSVQDYTSNRASINLSSNHGHVREEIPSFYTASSNLGPSSSSSSTFLENNDGPGPSFGTWGQSCKRKAIEGTSGHFYPGGSSSSSQPMGKSTMQDPVPNCYTGNLSTASSRLSLSPTNHLEQLNQSSGVGSSRAPSIFFPSSSIPIAESSARNRTIRSNLAQVPFETPRGTSARNYGVYASRSMSNTESSELRSPMNLPSNGTNTPNQNRLRPVNEARGTHPYPWNGSRGPISSGSFMISGERGSEINIRSSRRNNPEYPATVSAPETRNVVQDQIDWSFSPGASGSSRNRTSGHLVGPGSGTRASSSSSGWLPQQNQTAANNQQLSEAAPWIPFPRAESDSGIRRNQFTFFPSGSSSLDEVASISPAQQQFDQRTAAFLTEMQGEDGNGWRALAAVEGRHRLIRQVLNAMRRGVNLQAEDYMLIDPFIHGFAELHDRHRDMRLDVDNMSYEELLALEERIGNVSTGLSEEKIKSSMKQRKHGAMEVSPNMEPCCICQEEYITGDKIGILDCGHEFHNGCIKQWLFLKNICPICKMMALGT